VYQLVFYFANDYAVVGNVDALTAAVRQRLLAGILRPSDLLGIRIIRGSIVVQVGCTTPHATRPTLRLGLISRDPHLR